MRIIAMLSALCALMICPTADISSQETWSNIFDKREDLTHLIQLNDGHYLLSGRTEELGNKSDLVMLVGPSGQEIKRITVCDSCVPGHIVSSLETANGELLHFRSDGVLYRSDLDLENTEFVVDLSEDYYESVETYEVLRNNHFLVVVSYAVDDDDIKGLLHTVIDSRTKKIVSQKFNTSFPNIDGSIGVDLFKDQAVIDGYNLGDVGYLTRLGRYREVVWEAKLDFGKVILEQPLVAYNQQVYVVGTIVDENDPTHTQGLLASYDENGVFLWEKRFDAPQKDNNAYQSAAVVFTDIKQLRVNEFMITGHTGGTVQGENITSALMISVDKEGNKLGQHTRSKTITDNVVAADIIRNTDGVLVYVGNAFRNARIDGSYVASIGQLSAARDITIDASGMIYPNPASSQLQIQVDKLTGSEVYEILDVNGQVLRTSNLGLGNTINIEELDAGLYLLKLYKDKQVYVDKFVKI